MRTLPRLRPAHRATRLLLAPLLLALAAAHAASQDVNVEHPIAYIEARMVLERLAVLGMQQARPLIEGDRSAIVRLDGPDGEPPVTVKWKPVGRGAQGFNNEPRYELAAYQFQKLFLEELEYVVPPTVLRSMPLDEYRELLPAAQPTLRGANSVLFLMAYWVQNVTNREPFVETRFDTDTVYARHWGNLNILTHLIDHRDANVGNILVSTDPTNPRLFSVDNDVAFRSRVSDQGDDWRRLHVRRLPHATIERLRQIRADDLTNALAVLAEFQIVDGELTPVEPGENLNPGRGVRTTDDRVQFGLTRAEINDIDNRIRRLLEQVERGRIGTF